jgi:kynurenine formamidase
MNPLLLSAHLSRRSVLTAAATASAAIVLGSTTGTAQAQPADARGQEADFDDTNIDPAFVQAGGWGVSPYGSEDQRGTLNEVTPEKTAEALRLLGGRTVRTYNLSERLFSGFPALLTPAAPRIYEQRLFVTGFTPSPGFAGIVGPVAPRDFNQLSSVEERFPLGGTFQIGTQLDNLNHIGVGDYYYNGFRGPEIAETTGTTALGAEHIGPLVTRGILLDILAVKHEAGQMTDLVQAPNGNHSLRDDYRITVEDLRDGLRRAGVRRIEPGDVVLIRTGWNQMLYSDPTRYVGFHPGIYLRESRWLAQFRPAIIGADTWGVELFAGPGVQGFAQCHQELITHHGIRLQESVVLDDLARDRKLVFVYLLTPPVPVGATAINSGPAALVSG